MKRILFGLLAAGALLAAGCSSPFVTNTKMSAVEQMLLCTVVERGIAKSEFAPYKGKLVKMDYSHLDPQVFKDLIIAYTELHLASDGVIISRADTDKPDYIIQVSCGVLATDIDQFLIGTPPLPIPLPQADLSVVIPEIPLFRRIKRTGHGRFFFNIIKPDGTPVELMSGLNAEAQYINWTVLLIPFKTHNTPLADESRVRNEFLMPYKE